VCVTKAHFYANKSMIGLRSRQINIESESYQSHLFKNTSTGYHVIIPADSYSIICICSVRINGC